MDVCNDQRKVAELPRLSQKKRVSPEALEYAGAVERMRKKGIPISQTTLALYLHKRPGTVRMYFDRHPELLIEFDVVPHVVARRQLMLMKSREVIPGILRSRGRVTLRLLAKEIGTNCSYIRDPIHREYFHKVIQEYRFEDYQE